MHGVKRTRVPPTPDFAEQERKRLAKEEQKIGEYAALEAEIAALAKEQRWDGDMLDKTDRMVRLNPEFQTAWNHRRRCLLALFENSPEERSPRLASELKLTDLALTYNPKNYSVWEHRKWCLTALEDEAALLKALAKEMGLVELYLKKDARNFHTWNYRRFILSIHPSPPTARQELAVTTSKIAENFSNFSAWHYRTKLLGSLWSSRSADDVNKEKEEEFELVKQALWSDPADQSAWLYHRWLVGRAPAVELLRREIGGIEELAEEEPDSKWPLESLMFYKRLLVTLLPPAEQKEADTLNAACVEGLRKLAQIDPMRRGRYVDLERQILPARR